MQSYGFNYYPYSDESQLKKKKTSPLYYPPSFRLGNAIVEKSAFPKLSFHSLSAPIPVTIIALGFSISVKVIANHLVRPDKSSFPHHPNSNNSCWIFLLIYFFVLCTLIYLPVATSSIQNVIVSPIDFWNSMLAGFPNSLVFSFSHANISQHMARLKCEAGLALPWLKVSLA